MDDCCGGIQVGQKVPDFTIKTFEAAKGTFGIFNLAKQMKAKKWTVLFFYPGDFTFVCATEFAALAERYDRFRKLGAELVTVSTDTEYVHLAWQEHEGLLADVKYPMGADPTGNLCRLFGVLDESSGLALRGTFIINPAGELMNTEVNFFNLGRNVDELLRKLEGNIYLGKNPVQACPAQWKKPGDKTLTPSPDLVGKVAEEMNKG